MSLKSTINTYFDQRNSDYIDELKALTAIDSGSDDLAGLASTCKWLENRLREANARVRRFPQTQQGDHLLATWSGKGKGNILLLGHMDTVYARGTAGARPLTIEGDKILGPGSCDMKGGLLLGIYAVEALQNAGFDQFQTISFLIVSDEEAGERSAVPIIREQAIAADAILCLEAARPNGDIVCGRKAIRWYRIEAFGRSAHAGVDLAQGRNAILALAERIPALNHLNRALSGASLNIGMIAGGRTPNVVPDTACLRIDLRAYSEKDLDALAEAVKKIIFQDVPDGIRFTIQLEEGAYIPAMEKTPPVLRLRDRALAIAKDLGIAMDAVTTGGASDASFAAALGRAVLDGLGPTGGAAHSPDEYILRSKITERGCFLSLLLADCTDYSSPMG